MSTSIGRECDDGAPAVRLRCDTIPCGSSLLSCRVDSQKCNHAASAGRHSNMITVVASSAPGKSG